MLQLVIAVQFDFTFSIIVLAMVILGGMGNIWGVILGAVVLSFDRSLLQARRWLNGGAVASIGAATST